jgi:hypothetical protein
MNLKRGLIPKLAEKYPIQRPPMGMTPLGLDLWMEREVRQLLKELGYRWRLSYQPGRPKQAVLVRKGERRVGYAEKAWAALARALLNGEPAAKKVVDNGKGGEG